MKPIIKNNFSNDFKITSNRIEKEIGQYVPLTMVSLSLIAKAGISGYSVILYSLLMDRAKSSRNNGFIDQEGKPYIYYTIEEAKETLQMSANSIRKYFSELEELNLIEFQAEEQTQGYRKVRRIYVNRLEAVSLIDDEPSNLEETEIKVESSISDQEILAIEELLSEGTTLEGLQSCKKKEAPIASVSKEKEQRVAKGVEKKKVPYSGSKEEIMRLNGKSVENNRKKDLIKVLDSSIKQDSIYNKLANISADNTYHGNLQEIENTVARQINYSDLIERYTPNLVDYLLKLMTSLFTERYSTYNIHGKPVMISKIREEILKLNHEHIKYLLYSLQRTTTDITYLEHYFIASLYSINKNLANDRRGYFNYLAS